MELGLNIRDQLFTKLPVPATSFTGQTIIVTGASSGLGLETARHLVHLNAEHVILAVRSEDRGKKARQSILDSNPNTASKLSVWLLDLASYSSVQAFASRANHELTRLDCVIQNAGISVLTYKQLEDNESTLTINVISTFLLTFLLIPLLKKNRPVGPSDDASKTVPPRITIVSSASHVTTTIPTSNIYSQLNDPEKADMLMRYGASKLMQLLLIQSLADRIPVSDIQINCMDPGAARTNILRDIDHGIAKYFSDAEQFLLGRSPEDASRGIVYCIENRPETHGQYIAHAKIYQTSRFVRSERGKEAKSNLWVETLEKLEKIQLGVTTACGLKLKIGEMKDIV